MGLKRHFAHSAGLQKAPDNTRFSCTLARTRLCHLMTSAWPTEVCLTEMGRKEKGGLRWPFPPLSSPASKQPHPQVEEPCVSARTPKPPRSAEPGGPCRGPQGLTQGAAGPVPCLAARLSEEQRSPSHVRVTLDALRLLLQSTVTALSRSLQGNVTPGARLSPLQSQTLPKPVRGGSHPLRESQPPLCSEELGHGHTRVSAPLL